MQILCVAEKPSVARTATRILSHGKQQQIDVRIAKANPVYQFDGEFRQQKCKIVFTSVLGHLAKVEVDEAHQNWVCDPKDLFGCPLIKFYPAEMEPIKKCLEKLSKESQILQLWLDNDREGEAISEEVEEVCKRANPRIQVLRARCAALSDRDVIRAFHNPTDINRTDAAAVRLRTEIDLRAGYALTRYLTKTYKNLVKLEKGKVISYGPCQTPTLGFVVDAYLKHINFVPEAFWLIQVRLKKEGQPYELKWCRKRLFCKLSCFALYASVLDNPKCQVKSITQKDVTKFKPFPLATVELQKACSLYFKIDAHKTMEIAEKLYASGFISYPRTETDSFPDNFDFNQTVQLLTNYDQVGQYAQRLVGNVDLPRKGKHSDNAHPPIYPLKLITNDQPQDAIKIYTYICRHFLACCSKDAIVSETVVFFDVGGEDFKLKGQVIKALNWYEVFPYKTLSGKTIPEFHQGEVIVPTSIKMNDGKTVAPQLLTEPQLISKMDKEGIGTDATIAEHISNIQRKGFAKKEKSYFVPTPLGLALVEGFENVGLNIAKPTLRANMEATMQGVSAGTQQAEVAKQKFISEYKGVYGQLEDKSHELERCIRVQMAKQAEQQAPRI